MRSSTRWAALAAASLVLTGCGGSGADSTSASDSHTMPDGTVMDGSEHDGERHVHSDDHHGGDQTGPSEAAAMVCTGDVVTDVTRILGLDTVAEPSSSWAKPMFTCTFDLPNGPLELTVHDATDEATGKAHFETARADLGPTTPIKGVYGLGLPAFETDDGTVAFIREGKTLEVDATRLTGRLGVDGDMSRTEIAYAVATSVLACWTEHT